VEFQKAVWSIPKDRMKAGKAYNIYLLQQARGVPEKPKVVPKKKWYCHQGKSESKSVKASKCDDRWQSNPQVSRTSL
jgi:hypothetical protein